VDLSLGTIFAWAVFGLAVGLIARLLVPGRDPMGWVGSIFLGVVGSFVGGLIAYALKLGADPYAPAGWLLSIIGAALAVAVYHSFSDARRSPV